MIASYSPPDSTIGLFGSGFGDSNTYSGWLIFRFRCSPNQTHSGYIFPDTGTHLLDLPTMGAGEVYDSVKFDLSRFEGNATISWTSLTNNRFYDTTYSTDSFHSGSLRITEIDTINNLLSGTFNFLAIDTVKGSSMGDTVRIDSGVIYKMRLNRY